MHGFGGLFQTAFALRRTDGQTAQAFAQFFVRAHAARDNQRAEARVAQGFFRFGGQYVDNRVFKGAADVVARLFGNAAVFGAYFLHSGQDGGFQAGKTHLQIVRMQHGPGKGKGFGMAAFGQFGQFRAARVRQAEQFGGFIEGFARRVIHAFAQQHIIAYAAHGHKLSVAARYQQGDEGEGGFVGRQQRRKQMAFKVVDGDDWFVQGEGQRVGIARTGQKRAAQPRPLGEGHRVDVGIVFARVAQAGTGQRHEAADVVAAGQLGHHAAVFGVHGHLGVQGVGEQSAFAVVKGDAGFVAGRFDTEYQHDACPMRMGNKRPVL